jgi:hypothetical protein
MTTYTALRDPKRCPSHPGAALADILLDIHLPKTEIATNLVFRVNTFMICLLNANRCPPQLPPILGKYLAAVPPHGF